ncbi:protease inhibitor I9 family protein [Streptomyces resistomycificus]|uniref:Inhibitor I9 domain-containing protein n=1 Tax=Streptomyces resistomycificus TaxID=67356 RepID=A0A0L8LG76_9ACTN|nr:protease inhibitor I9 family protein [Streptomyces resistomycificus]KOG37109.1 hypothetical protein ADK37_11860 [Streptomyces resistomycificus]KUN95058.1 hypothetical protein AQJ84_23580 [Streptomyces resistomycificus]
MGALLIPVLAGTLVFSGAVLPALSEAPAAGQQNDSGIYVVQLSDTSAAYDDGALDAVPDGKKLHAYHYTAHGFTARLTGEQAAALGALPCVTSVTRSTLEEPPSSVPANQGHDLAPPAPSPAPLPAPSPPTHHGEVPAPAPQSMGGQPA